MKQTLNPKPISDYILIQPDKPTGGAFDVGSQYIDEVGIIKDTGPLVPEEIRKLKGKRVIFNAWACDEKTVQGQKFYLATASANAICMTI